MQHGFVPGLPLLDSILDLEAEIVIGSAQAAARERLFGGFPVGGVGVDRGGDGRAGDFRLVEAGHF